MPPPPFEIEGLKLHLPPPPSPPLLFWSLLLPMIKDQSPILQINLPSNKCITALSNNGTGIKQNVLVMYKIVH